MRALRVSVVAVACTSLAPLLLHAQTWTRITSLDLPSARSGARMAFHAGRGTAVLFGGRTGTTASPAFSAETWTWDGAAWGKATPASSPSARAGHALAYDEQRGEVVLFGGANTSSPGLGDTWTWNGVVWTQKSPSVSPPARSGHAMVYDPARKQVVLFGGSSNDAELADTWAWDGSAWTRLTPPTSPPARTGHSMAWDATRQNIVLFGSTRHTDTWTWDGAAWTNRTPPVDPGAAPGQTLVSHNGSVLRTRGAAALWDGANWLDVIATPIAPDIVLDPAIVYDPLRNNVVQFGGDPYGYAPVNSFWKFTLGAGCTFPADGGPSPSILPADGAAFPIRVPAPPGCAWNSVSDSAWVSPRTGTGSGTGTASIVMTAAPNPGPFGRTAKITVGTSRVYLVSQSQPACPVSGPLPATGPLYVRNDCGPITFTVTALAGEQIALRAIGRAAGQSPGDTATQASATLSLTGPAPSTEVRATAQPLSDTEPLTQLPSAGVFTFPAGGSYSITLTPSGGPQGYSQLDWVKTGQPCAVSVQQYSTAGPVQDRLVTVGPAGGPLPLLSVAWPPACGSATVVPPNAAWVTGAPSGVNAGFTRVALAAAPNYGGPRYAVTLFGTVEVGITQTADVSCQYTLAYPSFTAGPTRTASTVRLTTNCAWSASSPVPWAQVFPLSGSDSRDIQFTIFANFGTRPRSAVLSIADRPFTIAQGADTSSFQERFVKLLYNNFFGRTPTDAEVAFQANSGLSRAQLVSNFFISDEFNAQGRFIAGLYIGILNRDPEFGGWLFQRNALSTGQITQTSAISNFLDSQEFQLRNGTLTDREYVILLYRQVLFRTPSTPEVDFQAGALTAGLSRTALARNFLASAEFLSGINHRITPFLVYAALLGRDATSGEFQSAGAIAVAAAGQPDSASAQAKLRDDLLGPMVSSAEFNAIFQ